MYLQSQFKKALKSRKRRYLVGKNQVSPIFLVAPCTAATLCQYSLDTVLLEATRWRFFVFLGQISVLAAHISCVGALHEAPAFTKLKIYNLFSFLFRHFFKLCGAARNTSNIGHNIIRPIEHQYIAFVNGVFRWCIFQFARGNRIRKVCSINRILSARHISEYYGVIYVRINWFQLPQNFPDC